MRIQYKKKPVQQHGLNTFNERKLDMSIKLSTPFCPQCRLNDHYRSSMRGSAYDEETVDMVCSQGHNLKMVINVPKYVLLFENGLKAYNDEYYFEAFTCFYASLESFRVEFTKNFLNDKYNFSCQESNEFIHNLHLSERIFGAFALAYQVIFEKSAPRKGATDFKSDDVKLRNDVFHAGRIPTKEEVFNMGEKIYSFISLSYLNYKDEFFFPKIFTYNQTRVNEWLRNNSKDEDEFHAIMGFEKSDKGLFHLVPSIPYNSCYNKEVTIEDIPSFQKILETNKELAELGFNGGKY